MKENPLGWIIGYFMKPLTDDFWKNFEDNEYWGPGLRDIHAIGLGGCTPLHWAVISGTREAVEMLIEAGSVLDGIDETGRTCLHHATNSNRPDLVQRFLDLGLDPLVRDNKGKRAWDLVEPHLQPEVVAILEPVMMAIEERQNLESKIPEPNKTSLPLRL